MLVINAFLIVIIILMTFYIVGLRSEVKEMPVFTQSAAPEEDDGNDHIRYEVPKIETFKGCGSDDYSDLVEEDYQAWVAKQSIDPQTVANHRNFVAERLKNKRQNLTSGPFTTDTTINADPTPWIGLRRPQAVAIGTPTQVPGIDLSLFATKPNIRFG